MEKGFAFSFKFIDYTLSSYLEEKNLRFFLSNKFLVVGGERLQCEQLICSVLCIRSKNKRITD